MNIESRPDFQSELKKILTDCIEYEPCNMDGCGSGCHVVKRKQATQAITTLILETIGEDETKYIGTSLENETFARNDLLNELRTKFTNPKKGDEV